jgi:uncharacterized membrane protein YbhN (UPF0104 family)
VRQVAFTALPKNPHEGEGSIAGRAVRIAVSAVILTALFWQVGLVDVLATCLRANPWLLLGAFSLYVVSQTVSAVRWQSLASGVGFAVPLRRTVRIYFMGMFFGLAIPSTLGADGARALYLGQNHPGRARALSSVIFDRLVGLVTLVSVCVGGLLLGPRGELPRSLVLLLVGAGLGLVVVWLLAPLLARVLPKGQRLRTLIEDDLVPYFRDPKLLVRAIGLSLSVHALQIATQKVLTDALGLSVSLGFVAIYHPLVALAAAIPLTIGGFGLREAAYAYLLPHAGIRPDDAVALGLLWWAIGALGGVLGGLLYASEPSVRRDGSNPAESHDDRIERRTV